MGVWCTCYMTGNIMVKGLGGLLLARYGWRWSFWGCTMLSFAIWWLIFFCQRNKPEDVGLAAIVTDTPDTKNAPTTERVTFAQYARVALNPVVLAMGCSYFCIKFLRYALDSWLPAFLNIQGLDVDMASYCSSIFDIAGLFGAIAAGLLLDRVFKGKWAGLSFLLSLGLIGSYLTVITFGAHPIALAICFGLVGFMLYGPDTLISGAASVQVAGEKNGVAVAGIVNGLGSIGPVFQEQVIGWLMRGDAATGIRNTNLLALGMSIGFAVLMLVVIAQIRIARRAHDTT
jgi:sugar phosphate permease